MKIGILSDTHGWIHPRLYELFSDVEEIWHAGDIGNIETADALSAFKPLRAVYGNIDNATVRRAFNEHMFFVAEKVRVWITHIGGTPGHYDKRVKPAIYDDPPDIFVCGHSHIARVQHDTKGGFLFINPGSAGYQGFHNYMTVITLCIDGTKIHDFQLIELGERGKVILPAH
jgi:putative phosphoesterase